MCCLLFSFLLLLLSLRYQDHCIRHVSFEMNSTHNEDSTGGSMYAIHIGFRMEQTVKKG